MNAAVKPEPGAASSLPPPRSKASSPTRCAPATCRPRMPGGVARLMVEADLTGADGHGIFRLPQYVRRLKGGGVNPTPRIEVERAAPGVALVDGDNGMGHLVMSVAVDHAVALAREIGVAWVGVRRSNHAGPAALYVDMLARRGMVGIYSVVASANHMAIWGGTSSLLGTNPLAIAIPAGADAPPVVLDIATTVVSYGTVKKHVLNDIPLPRAGWSASRTAAPSPTRSAAARACCLPIGGHKGSGLALMLGLLAGTLNGAAFGSEVVDFNADSTTETNTGHFLLALDVARFMRPEAFARPARAPARRIACRRAAARHRGRAHPRRSPRRAEDARVRDGVPIAPPLRRQLDELAASLAIPPLADRL